MILRKLPRFAALLLLSLLFGGCPGGRDADAWRAAFLPTPRPQLKEPDAAFVARIDELELAIEEALRSPRDAARLAEAEGELGFFYFAYLEIDAAEPCFQNAATAAPKDWRWSYLLGFIRQLRGQLDAAATAYEQAAALAPSEIGPRLHLAETRIEQGQNAAAAPLLAEILHLSPGLPAALYQEARRLDHEGQAAAAAPLLEQALAAQPRAGAARYLLGQIYRRLGREDDARRELAAANEARVQFDDPLLRRLDDLGVSEGFYRLRAQRAASKGDDPGAAAAYRRLFGRGEGKFADHQRFAFTLYRLGEKEEALGELRRTLLRQDAATADAADRAEAHRLLALLLLENNDRQGAIAELRRALEALPTLAPARLLLAETLNRGGDSAGALAVFEQWLQLEPGAPRALLERGLLRFARGDAQAALADVRRAAELAPGDPVLQRRCGEIFEQAGDLVAARRSFEAATPAGTTPRDSEEAFSRAIAFGHLANLERRGDRPQRAEALYRSSLEVLPAFEVRLNLADLLMARGAFEEAAQLYELARAQQGQSVEARQGEAAALILLGRFGDARRVLETGLAELPRAGELRHLLARLLACAPSAGDRDAARALTLALDVVQAKATSQHAETLAMALAENGRFGEAAGLLRELITEGQKREEKKLIVYWQSQLAAYESQKAFRAAPPERFFRPKS